MEDITQGERAREYIVEGRTGPGQWQPLCKGTSIGHKWIHAFKPVEAAAVRLRVTNSVAEPVVKKLAVV